MIGKNSIRKFIESKSECWLQNGKSIFNTQYFLCYFQTVIVKHYRRTKYCLVAFVIRINTPKNQHNPKIRVIRDADKRQKPR